MHDRLRGLLLGLKRLLLLGLALGALVLGWLGFLRYGPGLRTEAPLFDFHARNLVRSRLGFPRPAPTLLLPVPQLMSSADVQLRLMKWWDGKAWLPEALAMGRVMKGGLQLRSGELVLGDLIELAGEAEGPCRIRIGVRWELPEELQELHRVREIVALRLPKGPAPGQTAEYGCVLVREGRRWEVSSVQSPWGERISTKETRRGPLDWFL